MGAVTFPEQKVVDYMSKNIVAVRVAHDHKPLAEQFQVKWTPTLITLDHAGKEHHRTVGFLPPEDLIPSLMLGAAKIHFDFDDPKGAMEHLDRILKEYPKCSAAAEAVFLKGVCGYKAAHNPKALREAYDKLTAEYPDSEWTKRAYPYRLIN
ncbi:MAG: thioredoxin fold domain-containing protein [Thermodesulfobacteriota bacterium]